MTLLRLLLLLTPALLSAQISLHTQTAQIDAYIVSYVIQQPEFPGVDSTPENCVAISIATTDAEAAVLGVYVRVIVDGGAMMVLRRTFERSFTEPTVITFSLGALRPTRIRQFYVVRHRQQQSDMLVPDSGR